MVLKRTKNNAKSISKSFDDATIFALFLLTLIGQTPFFGQFFNFSIMAEASADVDKASIILIMYSIDNFL